jgi:MFS family permease
MPSHWRSKFRRLPRDLILIGGMLTLVEGILWYFLPNYFQSKLNDMFLVGIVISAFSAGRIIVSLPAGDIADHIGRKFTFVFGIIGFIASVFFLFLGSFFYFALFMLLFGVFTIIYGIPTDASLLDHSTKRNAPIVLGLADVLHNFGWGFGPVIAGGLLLYFRVPTFISIVIVALVAVSVFSLFAFPGKCHFNLKEFRKSRKILLKDGIYGGEFKRLLKLGNPLLAILIFSFAFGFWEYAIWTFEPIWTKYVGAGLLLGAVILMLDSVPYIPFTLISGFVTNKLGLEKMFAIGAAFTLLGQSFFLFNQTLLTLTLTLVVTPVGISFLAIPLEVYIKRHVKNNVYGQVYGADNMAYDIGGVIAPLVVGTIAIMSNMSAIIYVSFALFLISIAALTFVFVVKKS